MSLDVTLEKKLTITDIHEDTSINVEKNGSDLENVFRLTKNGYTIGAYCKEDNDWIETLVMGYDDSAIKEVLGDIVTTFNTRFITDEEWMNIIHDEKNELDHNELFNEATSRYGFTINEDGTIEYSES